MAGVRFESERNSLTQRRISNQSMLLGVEIDTSEKVLLMKQGFLPMDLALVRRYEAHQRIRDVECGLFSAQLE